VKKDRVDLCPLFCIGDYTTLVRVKKYVEKSLLKNKGIEKNLKL
jgi:hypothetical protein